MKLHFSTKQAEWLTEMIENDQSVRSDIKEDFFNALILALNPGMSNKAVPNNGAVRCFVNSLLTEPIKEKLKII